MNWHILAIILLQLAYPTFHQLVTEFKNVKGRKDCDQYVESVGTLRWKAKIEAGRLVAECRLEKPRTGFEYAIVWSKTVGRQPEKVVQECAKKSLVRLKDGSLSCKYAPPFTERGYITCFVISVKGKNLRTRCTSDKMTIDGTHGRIIYPPKRTTKHITKLIPSPISLYTVVTMDYIPPGQTTVLLLNHDSNTAIPFKQETNLYVIPISTQSSSERHNVSTDTNTEMFITDTTLPKLQVFDHTLDIDTTTYSTTLKSITLDESAPESGITDSTQSTSTAQTEDATEARLFYVSPTTITNDLMTKTYNDRLTQSHFSYDLPTRLRRPQSKAATRRHRPELKAATRPHRPDLKAATWRRRRPELNDATRRYPELNDATRLRPMLNDATQRRPKLNDATRRRPKLNDATRRRHPDLIATNYSSVGLDQQPKNMTIRPILARLVHLKKHEEDKDDKDDDTVVIEGWFLRLALVLIGLAALVVAGAAIGKSLALKYYNRFARDCCPDDRCTPCPGKELVE